MNDENLRTVSLARMERACYRVTNPRGGFLQIGEGDDTNFTPVELLLAAIAGCTAIDVDYLTTKRAEPQRFEILVSGVKKSDDDGNRLEDIVVGFDVTFPDDEAGRRAAGRLEAAIDRSHDRLCTVSRTVELGTPVQAGLRS